MHIGIAVMIRKLNEAGIENKGKKGKDKENRNQVRSAREHPERALFVSLSDQPCIDRQILT